MASRDFTSPFLVFWRVPREREVPNVCKRVRGYCLSQDANDRHNRDPDGACTPRRQSRYRYRFTWRRAPVGALGLVGDRERLRTGLTAATGIAIGRGRNIKLWVFDIGQGQYRQRRRALQRKARSCLCAVIIRDTAAVLIMLMSQQQNARSGPRSPRRFPFPVLVSSSLSALSLLHLID